MCPRRNKQYKPCYLSVTSIPTSSKRKRRIIVLEFGRSLWSAKQLPAQGIRHRPWGRKQARLTFSREDENGLASRRSTMVDELAIAVCRHSCSIIPVWLSSNFHRGGGGGRRREKVREREGGVGGSVTHGEWQSDMRVLARETIFTK